MDGPIRIGDTVRRPVRPWTPAVHAVLRHLEKAGFPGAPRVLGIDEQNREILTHVPGVDGRAARCYDDANLIRVARMIREFHDALADFTPPAGISFRPEPSAPPGNLICHNDLGPANTIYAAGRPRAFIDWELAVPSTPEWELSYAVRTFVPLYPDAECVRFGYGVPPRGRRLALFCDAYGLTDRSRLLPTVELRLAGEDTPFAARCRDFLRRHREEWQRALH
jgi:phosphotransferase family enzyme